MPVAHTDTMTEPVLELRARDGAVAAPDVGASGVRGDVASPVSPRVTSAPTPSSEVDDATGAPATRPVALAALVALLSHVGGATARAFDRAGALVGADDAWWEPGWPRLARRGRRVLGPGRAEDGPGGRRQLRWGQVLGVGLVAFALWLLCDAPTLLHNAEGSPLGARRTAAMVVLRPVAALSRDLGLSHLVGAADRLMGRTGGGVLQVVGPPSHHGHDAHRGATPGAHATDALPPLPAPSAASPLRVLSIGDSLGVDFGGPFVNDLAATGVVNATLDAHVDTGLARPDYFDWSAELRADLARYQPEAVVVFLGANDPQNFVDGGSALAYGTEAWTAAYARRVGELMAEATSAGARVLWVGMPPMADPTLGAKMQALDAIYQGQAAAHPGVTYLSSWTVLGDAQGAYAQYLPDPSGSQVAVREPDGTHISPGGAERLSEAAIADMDHAWGLSLRP